MMKEIFFFKKKKEEGEFFWHMTLINLATLFTNNALLMSLVKLNNS